MPLNSNSGGKTALFLPQRQASLRPSVLLALALGFSCFFGRADELKPKTHGNVPHYDKTIGDTRVVLLSIAQVNVLMAPPSTNQMDTTYLEITYLTENVGTNLSNTNTPAQGAVVFYLKGTDQKEVALQPDVEKGVFINGLISAQLPYADVPVTNPKACHSTRVFLHGVSYPHGAKASCVIQEGFNGHLASFRFNDILLPGGSVFALPNALAR